jgi:hypothetical protein
MSVIPRWVSLDPDPAGNLSGSVGFDRIESQSDGKTVDQSLPTETIITKVKTSHLFGNALLHEHPQHRSGGNIADRITMQTNALAEILDGHVYRLGNNNNLLLLHILQLHINLSFCGSWPLMKLNQKTSQIHGALVFRFAD